jgi:hypothetical protein
MPKSKNKKKSSAKAGKPAAQKSQNGHQSVSVPAAMSAVMKNGGPTQRSLAGGAMEISHTEQVTENLSGSADFSVIATIPLQPGLRSVFSWLSGVATRFDQYALKKCRLRYVPNAPTDRQGTIIIAPDYDALDPPPTSERIATAMADSVTSPVWREITVDLDPKKLMALGPRRFVRTTKVINSDLKTYDCGNIFVCAAGFVAEQLNAGKIFVDYTVQLFAPEIADEKGSPDAILDRTDTFAWTSESIDRDTVGTTTLGGITSYPSEAGNWSVFGGDRLKCVLAGRYRFDAFCNVAATATQGSLQTRLEVLKNDVLFLVAGYGFNSNSIPVSSNEISFWSSFEADDVLTLQISQLNPDDTPDGTNLVSSIRGMMSLLD